jgi:hypothetical protein
MSHGPAATATEWIQGYKNILRKVSVAKKEDKTTMELINFTGPKPSWGRL